MRTKFLAVMCSLLGLCLGTYLFMAITVFKSDKTQLVFDLNRSQVSNLTSELETQFNGVSEKLKVFALLPAHLQAKMAGELLSENSDVVAVSIHRESEAKPERSFFQERFLETYGLRRDVLDRLMEHAPVPFEEILRQGEAVWNASIPDHPPLIGYGRLVVRLDDQGVPLEQWAVVGLIQLDRFLKSVSIVSLSQVVVVNKHGAILVQSEGSKLAQHPSLANDSLFKEALAMKSKISVVNRDGDTGRVFAALARGFNDQIFVVARASEAHVFQVVKDLSIRTLLFGSIVLTLVVLAAFLISRSLTENIAQLVDGMEAVAKGDLTTRIQLRGRDETVLLARSFNQMIEDLRQSRDALETMNRELDQKVKDRTAQLEEQNKKVKEVQEALLRTTRLASVGELAGRAAHEVLNPLTILLTRAGLVQKKLNTEPPIELLEEIRQAWAKDYADGGLETCVKNWQSPSQLHAGQTLFQEDLENLERVSNEWRGQTKALAADMQFIREEGERINKIIQGMRRMGHLKTDSKAQSVHALLDECCLIMADLFEQKACRIERDFHAEHDVCVVDRDEMIQALTNLMRNSLQALAEDQVGAHLIFRSQTRGQELWIEVEDNGLGIAPEHQARLFDASFTTKSRDEGTGLGLGIARRFVREFGGDIEFVSSTPSTATIFRIRLPLAAAKGHQRGVAA